MKQSWLVVRGWEIESHESVLYIHDDRPRSGRKKIEFFHTFCTFSFDKMKKQIPRGQGRISSEPQNQHVRDKLGKKWSTDLFGPPTRLRSLWKPHQSKDMTFLHRSYTQIFFSTPMKFFFSVFKKNITFFPENFEIFV